MIRQALLVIFVIMLGSASPLAAQWNITQRTSSLTLLDMDFFHSKTGIVVGRGSGGTHVNIMRTTNGGKTWITIDSSAATTFFGGLYSVSFASKDIIYASGASVIIKSLDAGIAWDTVPGPYFDIKPNSFNEQRFTEIKFISPSNGFGIVNSNCIYKTTDGGMHWQMLKDGRKDSPNYFELHAIDSNHIYFARYDTTDMYVLYSKDGRSFQNFPLHGFKRPVSKIYFMNANRGYILSGTALYSTKDGGSTWDSTMNLTQTDLLDIQFLDSNTGFLSDALCTTFITEDAGLHWAKCSQEDSNKIFISLDKIYFFDKHTAAALSKTPFDKNLLLYTETLVSGIKKTNISRLDFNIYPNPAHDMIYIDGLKESGRTSFLLLNLLGQMVATPVVTSFGTNTSLDIGNLPPGQYILEIRSGEEVGHKELVVY